MSRCGVFASGLGNDSICLSSTHLLCCSLGVVLGVRMTIWVILGWMRLYLMTPAGVVLWLDALGPSSVSKRSRFIGPFVCLCVMNGFVICSAGVCVDWGMLICVG